MIYVCRLDKLIEKSPFNMISSACTIEEECVKENEQKMITSVMKILTEIMLSGAITK